MAAATGDTATDMAAEGAAGKAAALPPGEPMGIFFPVHGWRVPAVVGRFVEGLDAAHHAGRYCYALCTAGDTAGEAMDRLKAALRSKGVSLSAVFSLIMPESYVGLPFMDVDTKEKEKAKLAEAERAAAGYAEAVKGRRSVEEIAHRGRWPRVNSRVVGAFFHRFLVTDRPFRVDAARCVKCGICADVCPVGDIAGGLGSEPGWRHNGLCLTCFACYHHCPQKAIAFGRRTAGKGQYFHK